LSGSPRNGRFFLRLDKVKVILIISAVFFAALAIYLHHKYLFWDFCAYKLTGDFLLNRSPHYAEVFRPPLVPLFLSALGPAWYFLVSELLLAIAAYFFAKRLRLNPLLFYFLILAPVAAVQMVTEGSEVLALSLGILALAFFDSPLAGLFLGMAFLARYGMILYVVPLIWLAWPAYHKRPSIIMFQAVAFLAVVAPWLLYNAVVFGHPLASMLDFMFLNGTARSYLWHPPDLRFLGVLLPTVLLAVPTRRKHVPWLAFALIVLVVYVLTPLRAVRYVIPALPFLSVVAAENISESSAKRALSAFVVITSIFGAFVVATHTQGLDPRPFASAAYALGSCPAVSNAWVPLACVGSDARPLVTSTDMDGRAVVIFHGFSVPRWFKGDPYAAAFYPSSDYNLFVPSRCEPSKPFISSYLQTYSRLSGKDLSYDDVLSCILHLRSC